MRISDWSSDVCSSDLREPAAIGGRYLLFREDQRAQRFQRILAQVRILQRGREIADRAAHVVLAPIDEPGRAVGIAPDIKRSAGRRVGKEGVSTCRSRGSPAHYKKTTKVNQKII